MPLERWSDRIVVVHLADDPQFTEDLYAFDTHVGHDVVLDFAGVRGINSTHLARLLKLRKQAIADGAKLILCGLNNDVWGTLLVTGLDCLFEFSDDVSTALATLQIGSAPS